MKPDVIHSIEKTPLFLFEDDVINQLVTHTGNCLSLNSTHIHNHYSTTTAPAEKRAINSPRIYVQSKQFTVAVMYSELERSTSLMSSLLPVTDGKQYQPAPSRKRHLVARSLRHHPMYMTSSKVGFVCHVPY